jgi:hypothetical protein
VKAVPGGIAVSVAFLTLLAHSAANACLPEPGGLMAMALCAGLLELLVRALRGRQPSAGVALALSLPVVLVGQFIGHIVMAHGVVAGSHHHDGARAALGSAASHAANPLLVHVATFVEPRMLTFHLASSVVAALLLVRCEQVTRAWQRFIRSLMNPLLVPALPLFRHAGRLPHRPGLWTSLREWSPLRGRAPPLFI